MNKISDMNIKILIYIQFNRRFKR